MWKRNGIGVVNILNTINMDNVRDKIRILIVDDERPALLECLRDRGYHVFYKEDMTYSIEAEPFDILLVDIKGIAKRRQSSMEGFELAAEIKKNYPLKKVGCYSGDVVKTAVTERRDEVDLFFRKDDDPDKISEKLDKLINEYIDYEAQWHVIDRELRNNNVDERNIEVIKKNYYKTFRSGKSEGFSKLNASLMEIVKDGTTLLNVINSILTLIKLNMG